MAAQDPSAYTDMGISGVLAIELAAQVTAGVGNADRLMAAGSGAAYAVGTANLITTGTTDPLTLAKSCRT